MRLKCFLATVSVGLLINAISFSAFAQQVCRQISGGQTACRDADGDWIRQGQSDSSSQDSSSQTTPDTEQNAVSDSAEAASEAQEVAAQEAAKAAANQALQPLSFLDPAGISYAALRETTWTTKQEQDEMTDKTTLTVTSEQQNDTGANAEVTGLCVNNSIVFTALAINSADGSAINLADQETLFGIESVGGQIRYNANPSRQTLFQFKDFSNEVQIASLSKNPSATGGISAGSVWKIMARINTDHGEITIKIPIYDPQIEDLVNTCP